MTYTASKTFQWPRNSEHTIVAADKYVTSSIHYHFGGWSGLPAGLTQTITVGSTAVMYSATCKRHFGVSTIINPSGTGSVTLSPAEVNGVIPEGTTVRITATPLSG